MIISASRRTDIPAYYSDWLLNRLHAGHVLVRNPMNHGQIRKVNLSPELVDCIVFWTKNPRNILGKLEVLDGMKYRYYFHFTLTPYDKSLERNLPDKEEIIDTYIHLSRLIGKDRVFWRYDPIILNERISIDYHKEHFARLCERIGSYTESVTISFVDMYPKVKTSLIREIQPEEIAELSEFIGKTAKDFGLRPIACSENTDLSRHGIERASCIDKAVIERVCGYPLDIKQDKNQRKSCGCYESIDIGAYNSCLHNCVYCYANYCQDSVQRNIRRHNPNSELQIGTLRVGEKVQEIQGRSLKNFQLKLF